MTDKSDLQKPPNNVAPRQGGSDGTIETRTCVKCRLTFPLSEFPPKKGRPTELSLWCKTCVPAHLASGPDLKQEPGPASSESDQQGLAPAPKPATKHKYRFIMGAYGNWYIIDKDDKIVGHASTGEQALMTMLRMNGKPHDRFQTLWEQEVSKVVDTRGGVPCVVKTCKTLQEARAEADRLNKENQQLR